jgi:hypothetical protein
LRSFPRRFILTAAYSRLTASRSCLGDPPALGRAHSFHGRTQSHAGAILAQWGITALRNEQGDPQQALTFFLEALKFRVENLE